jgi:hypothetical protein
MHEEREQAVSHLAVTFSQPFAMRVVGRQPHDQVQLVIQSPPISEFDTLIQNMVYHQRLTARQKALGTTDMPRW